MERVQGKYRHFQNHVVPDWKSWKWAVFLKKEKRNQCHGFPCRNVILEHIYRRLQGNTESCREKETNGNESESKSLL